LLKFFCFFFFFNPLPKLPTSNKLQRNGEPNYTYISCLFIFLTLPQSYLTKTNFKTREPITQDAKHSFLNELDSMHFWTCLFVCFVVVLCVELCYIVSTNFHALLERTFSLLCMFCYSKLNWNLTSFLKRKISTNNIDFNIKK
jgi:hypothetical protein